MLKRHLRAAYGLSPEEYRAKWGLPADYPMVAPNYAKQRSNFAKQIGLGRKKGEKVGSRRNTGKAPQMLSNKTPGLLTECLFVFSTTVIRVVVFCSEIGEHFCVGWSRLICAACLCLQVP